eukprot:scaffold421216_cov54-Attheya_sp.AAC.1
MPEVHDNVNASDRMNIHSMTEKGDKKHAKREAKARLKNTFYHIHDDKDLLYNGIGATYKILDNRDKVKLKMLYHIRCDPELGQGFCAMQCIPCACNACIEAIIAQKMAAEY